MDKQKTEIPSWQPTRLQLAKSHIKDCLVTAALFGAAALGVLLYLAFMALVFHRRR